MSPRRPGVSRREPYTGARPLRRGQGLLCLFLAAGLLGSGCRRRPPATAPATPAALLDRYGIAYQLESRDTPRPLRLHQIQVDLTHTAAELAVVLAPDPDGAGPAEAILTQPLVLARQSDALVLVNCHPFGDAPGRNGKPLPGYYPGKPVDIRGLAVSAGVVRSPDSKGNVAFWVDAAGMPHLGHPKPGAPLRQGAAGFGWLIRAGQSVCRPTPGALHPRTALGLDRQKQTLTLLVVDGRQPGFSEGMSTGELAVELLRLGCHEGINLDGGGSSILVLAQPGGGWQAANHPSTQVLGVPVHRPLPSALVLRPRCADR